MSTDTKFVRLAKLRSVCATEQVAAVCYRIRGGEIEFLLVQTGGGRWIFPKGGVEPGLTHAQAAAIEAFEEAGVHGRIEEEPFIQYKVHRPGKRSPEKHLVSAHLCEVLRLTPPQEKKRNRTWFSSENCLQRLKKDRLANEGSVLARVVTRAVVRIRKSQGLHLPVAGTPAVYNPEKDPLQKVQFEAAASARTQNQDAIYMQYIRSQHQEQARGRALAGSVSRPPRLSGMVASAIQKVVAIDRNRVSRSKARI